MRTFFFACCEFYIFLSQDTIVSPRHIVSSDIDCLFCVLLKFYHFSGILNDRHALIFCEAHSRLKRQRATKNNTQIIKSFFSHHNKTESVVIPNINMGQDRIVQKYIKRHAYFGSLACCAIPQKEKGSRRRLRGKTISDAIKFVVTMTIVLVLLYTYLSLSVSRLFLQKILAVSFLLPAYKPDGMLEVNITVYIHTILIHWFMMQLINHSAPLVSLSSPTTPSSSSS